MSQLCFVMSDLLRGLWLTSKNSHIRKFIESAQQCGLFGYYMYHANYVSSTLLPLMCSWYGIKWSQSFIPKLVNCFANLHVHTYLPNTGSQPTHKLFLPATLCTHHLQLINGETYVRTVHDPTVHVMYMYSICTCTCTYVPANFPIYMYNSNTYNYMTGVCGHLLVGEGIDGLEMEWDSEKEVDVVGDMFSAIIREEACTLYIASMNNKNTVWTIIICPCTCTCTDCTF